MEIKKWLGLRNVTSTERYKPGHLEVAQNCDIDDTRALRTRLGVALAQAGSYHSLWADECDPLVSSGSNLYRVNADYSLTLLARLSASARMSYNRQLNTIYGSNGVDTVRIHEGAVKLWGTPPPTGQPVAAAAGGALPPGRYTYAMTYRRASGAESGTGLPGQIDLASAGGIAFSSMESSTDPDVVESCIYLSGADGEELFLAAVVPAGTSSFAFRGAGTELGQRLETMFDNPPPPGSIVECYNGVMYVVAGNVAWHSRPYQFERFCHRDQFLQFPGAVTLFASTNDGIYVGTDQTVWFLSGDHPSKMQSRVVFNYGAVPGTAVKTTAGVLKAKEESEEGTPGSTAVMWTSPQGVCIGLEGGQVENLTELDYSFPSGARGAAVVRARRGMTQYLTVLEGGGVSANAYP